MFKKFALKQGFLHATEKPNSFRATIKSGILTDVALLVTGNAITDIAGHSHAALIGTAIASAGVVRYVFREAATRMLKSGFDKFVERNAHPLFALTTKPRLRTATEAFVAGFAMGNEFMRQAAHHLHPLRQVPGFPAFKPDREIVHLSRMAVRQKLIKAEKLPQAFRPDPRVIEAVAKTVRMEPVAQ